MRYAVVIEKTATGYSAYAPDLPGCIAAGTTVEETSTLIRHAIELHVAGLREEGTPVPEPTTRVDYVSLSSLPA